MSGPRTVLDMATKPQAFPIADNQHLQRKLVNAAIDMINTAHICERARGWSRQIGPAASSGNLQLPHIPEGTCIHPCVNSFLCSPHYKSIIAELMGS